ncbi:MAG: DUF2088 domain-containing protein [Candidatus Fermentibacteraceae bacterium]|nr:DUF2088 domain-containing protein [Candidatus Fermentibacteraceae bacterium]
MISRLRVPEDLQQGAVSISGDIPPPLSVERIRVAWEPVMSRLEEFRGGEAITLVVNDSTRPPSFRMLTAIEHELSGNVRILFATGTHRPVTPEEKNLLLGGLFSEAPWKNSDCDSDDMVYIGRTSRGTPVSIDPWILDGYPVVSVNSVEPHYFAGYTGGRKSFIPGVSARKTIVSNHFLACLPEAIPGELNSNPVHLDMMEALELIEDRAEIVQGNGVVNEGELVHFNAGSCEASFMTAVDACSRLSTLTETCKSPVVVLHPGSPLDVSLYQSEKAIYNCHSLVEDGGVLLLVSSCTEGLGADHMEKAFKASMDSDWATPEIEQYNLGDHTIVRLKNMRRRIRFALASGLPDEIVSGMGIEPVHDIVGWLRQQGCRYPLFIPRAGFVVPVAESDV